MWYLLGDASSLGVVVLMVDPLVEVKDLLDEPTLRLGGGRHWILELLWGTNCCDVH